MSGQSTRTIKNYDIKINIDGLEIICRATQAELLTYLGNNLPAIYGDKQCTITNDYIFAKGEIPMCLVCHLDTVHKDQVDSFWYDKAKGIVKSDEGIGGDDRCGVYALLKILHHYREGKKPSLLFTTDEEVGCVGARIAAVDLVDKAKDFKYLIEFDRKGSNDAVFYQTVNDDFVNYIQEFGFVKSHGSVSDISRLSEIWDMASVNLSSGYYKAHTVNEYIVISELENNINRAINIIDDIDNVEQFEFRDADSVAKNTTHSNFNYQQYIKDYDDWYENNDKHYPKSDNTKSVIDVGCEDVSFWINPNIHQDILDRIKSRVV